eukprot:PhM_4_TR18647/c0_g1_i2/m.47521
MYKQDLARQQNAALILTAFIRRAALHNRRRRANDVAYESDRNDSARMLQSFIVVHHKKRRFLLEDANENENEELLRREDACVAVQSAVKGYLVRHRNYQSQHATRIQSCWRSHSTRRNVFIPSVKSRMSRQELRFTEDKRAAAVLLASFVRVCFLRRRRMKYLTNRMRHEAAATIQNTFRVHHSRCVLKAKKKNFEKQITSMLKLEESHYAQVLQRRTRVCQSKAEVEKRRTARNNQKAQQICDLRTEAALRIQHSYTSRLFASVCRRACLEARTTTRDRAKDEMNDEAARSIQSFLRGRLFLRAARRARRELLLFEAQTDAATVIQQWIFSKKLRQIYTNAVVEQRMYELHRSQELEAHVAVVCLQNFIRQRQTRRKCATVAQMMCRSLLSRDYVKALLFQKQTQSSCTIQRALRCWAARHRLRDKLQARNDEYDQMRRFAQNKAATDIQRLAHANTAKKRVEARRVEVIAARRRDVLNAAAMRIQSVVRGQVARKDTSELRLVRAAAFTMIRIARGFLGRLRARRAAEKRLKVFAAMKIQSIVRMFTTRLDMKKFLRQLEDEEREYERVQATVYIQKVFRGHRDRQYVRVVRDLVDVRRRAALRVQRCLQVNLARARRGAKEELVAAERQYDILDGAALDIQRVYRGYVGRRIAAEHSERFSNARKHISKVFSGFATRKRIYTTRAMQKYNNAAAAIQSLWATYRHIKQTKEARANRLRVHALNALREASAVRVQKVYRGHLSRRRCSGIRARNAEAATTIQRTMRGHWGRMRARDVRRKAKIHACAGRIQMMWSLRGESVKSKNAEARLTGRLLLIESKQLTRKESVLRTDLTDEEASAYSQLSTIFKSGLYEMTTRTTRTVAALTKHIEQLNFEDRSASGDANCAASKVQTAVRRAEARGVVQRKRALRMLGLGLGEDGSHIGCQSDIEETTHLTEWMSWMAQHSELRRVAGLQRFLFKEASARRRLESEATAALHAFAHPTTHLVKRIERNDPHLTSIELSHQLLSPDALRDVLRALHHNEYVTALHLDNVRSVSDAVVTQELRDALTINTRIVDVTLDHTPITDLSATALLEINTVRRSNANTLVRAVVFSVENTLMTRLYKMKVMPEKKERMMAAMVVKSAASNESESAATSAMTTISPAAPPQTSNPFSASRMTFSETKVRSSVLPPLIK